MATAIEVFEALPHVQEVWITKDGHHHLSNHQGGEKFDRAEKITEQAPDTKVKSGNKK